MDIVDLTDDTAEPAPPPRITALPRLPATTAYTLDSAVNFSSSFPAAATPAGPLQRGPWPTIRFSLTNTTEFTAKATGGTVSKEVISTIKLVSGVRFDRRNRQFVFPIACHSQLVAALGSLQVHVEPLPQDSRNRLTLQKRMESSFSSDEFERALNAKLPTKLLDALAQFQRDGVQFVFKNKGRAIIADEMGLGKTIQAIASACMYRESWPVLVVAPSSARHHWKMELENWLCTDTPGESEEGEQGSEGEVCRKEDIVLVDSPAKANIILHKPHKFAIISYHYLTKLEAILCAKKYKMIIVDESHFLKNGKAKRTKSMNIIAEGAARVLLLTGTPALSRPYELFTQLHLLAPKSWDSEYNFCRRYCQGRGSGTGSWGGEAKMGASHCAELHATLFGTIMIRRLKKDTLTALPAKTRHIVRVEVLDEVLKEELRSLLALIEMSKSKRRGGNGGGLKKFVDSEELLQGRTSFSSMLSTSSTPSPRSSNDCDTNLPESDRNSDRDASHPPPAAVLPAYIPDFSLPPSVYTPTGESRQPEQQDEQRQHQQLKQQPQQLEEEEREQQTEANGPEVEAIENEDADQPPTKRMLLMELFTKSGIAKIDMVIRSVETFLSNPVSGKLIIFAHHKKVLDRLSTYLTSRGTDFIRIDGSTASKARHQKMLHFQTVPTCRVAVLAITAAGVAITLTAARSVFFAELFWTPGSMLQAEDRVHRIGQLSPVHITYFLGKNTVDDVLWPLLQKKMKTLGEVFEGERNVELIAERGESHSEDLIASDNDSGGGGRDSRRNSVEGENNLEVFGLVEEISLEEEQKLCHTETEGGADDEDSDTGEDDCGQGQLAGHGGVVLREPDGVSVDVFEYDGLAQAMLRTTSEQGSELECVLLAEEEEEEEPRVMLPQRQHSLSLQGRSEIVDLVSDDEEEGEAPQLVVPMQQNGVRDNKPETHVCIDLDDTDSDDEEEVELEEEEEEEEEEVEEEEEEEEVGECADRGSGGGCSHDNAEIEAISGTNEHDNNGIGQRKRKLSISPIYSSTTTTTTTSQSARTAEEASILPSSSSSSSSSSARSSPSLVSMSSSPFAVAVAKTTTISTSPSVATASLLPLTSSTGMAEISAKRIKKSAMTGDVPVEQHENGGYIRTCFPNEEIEKQGRRHVEHDDKAARTCVSGGTMEVSAVMSITKSPDRSVSEEKLVDTLILQSSAISKVTSLYKGRGANEGEYK